ncbi:hypothetical protein QJQ45_001986 [Haematococcus lacustris]|nr:hypothetical protein QJQ45_001986 [Haematococcus lacustris]
MQSVRTPAIRGAFACRPLSVPQRVSLARNAKRSLRVTNLFGLFAPAKPTTSPNPKAKELLKELIAATRAGPRGQDDVADLVKQLQPLGVKSPVRNKLFFGTFDVVYSSKPGTEKAPRLTIEEPNLIREESEFKTFGLLPGRSTQSGEVGALDDYTYEVGFDRLELQGGLGDQRRDIDIVYSVQLLYLDENYRITETKEGDEAEEDEDEDDMEEEGSSGRAGSPFFFGGAPREGTATIAEREVRKKMAAKASQGSQAAGIRLPVNLPAAPPSPTMKLGGRQPAGAPVTPKASPAKGTAEQAKAAAIREALEELAEELKEANAGVREANQQLRDVERANAGALKQLAPAKARLAASAETLREVEEELSQAAKARAAAEAELRAAQAQLNAAQARRKSLMSR